MKRMIMSNTEAVEAATGDTNEGLDTVIADIEADFDFILSGLDKLGRMGTDKAKEGQAIGLEISGTLKTVLDTVNSAISGGESAPVVDEPAAEVPAEDLPAEE